MSEVKRPSTVFEGRFSPFSDPIARRVAARHFPILTPRDGDCADAWIASRSFGVGILKLAASEYADYQSLVDGARALDDIWETRAQRYPGHLLSLGPFVEGDLSGARVEAWAKKRGLLCHGTELARAPVILIENTWQQYHDAKRGKFWHNINRAERQIAASFGPLIFSLLEKPGEMQSALPGCLDLYRTNWSRLTSSSFFLTVPGGQLLQELLVELAAGGKAEIARLELAGRLIAFSIGFKIDSIYYFYIFATQKNPEYARFSIGKILLRHLLESVFVRGFRAFDFMAGEEPYKFEWTHESRSRRNYDVIPDDWAARQRLAFLLFARRGVMSVKNNDFVRGTLRQAARLLTNGNYSITVPAAR